jgi:hypothetical protein
MKNSGDALLILLFLFSFGKSFSQDIPYGNNPDAGHYALVRYPAWYALRFYVCYILCEHGHSDPRFAGIFLQKTPGGLKLLLYFSLK